jgi:O-methyltransferase
MKNTFRKMRTFVNLVYRRDSRARFLVMRMAAGWILPGYRFHWPQLLWWDDESFTAYLKKFDQLQDSNSHRHWMVAQLMRLVSDLSGDTVECGVFKGASSYLICKANQTAQDRRVHHVFDSFAGLSEPSAVDGSFWSEGDLACHLDVVKANLSEFDENTVKFYPGWIPDRFSDVDGQRFSFVHIDVDLYGPTWNSLAYFYPRMQVGGIILCDDYGFTTCPGATIAIDEYLLDKPEPMISLPCGGGFLIKK